MKRNCFVRANTEHLLIDGSILIFRSRGSDCGAYTLDKLFLPALELTAFQAFRLAFDFLPRKFAAC